MAGEGLLQQQSQTGFPFRQFLLLLLTLTGTDAKGFRQTCFRLNATISGLIPMKGPTNQGVNSSIPTGQGMEGTHHPQHITYNQLFSKISYPPNLTYLKRHVGLKKNRKLQMDSLCTYILCNNCKLS